MATIARHAGLHYLSGVLKFVRDSHEPVLPGAAHKHYANGRRDLFVHIRETLQLRAEFGEVTVTVTDAQGDPVQQPTPPPLTITISALAMHDAAVTKAMRLFAAPDVKTWVGLYRLHEVIEADVGGAHSLGKRDWGSKHDLKRFNRLLKNVASAGSLGSDGAQEPECMCRYMRIPSTARPQNAKRSSLSTAC